MEAVLQGSLQAASAISTRISQMDKNLREISKYVTEVNSEIKSDLQALDKSTWNILDSFYSYTPHRSELDATSSMCEQYWHLAAHIDLLTELDMDFITGHKFDIVEKNSCLQHE
jgi:hypothetical protein